MMLVTDLHRSIGRPLYGLPEFADYFDAWLPELAPSSKIVSWALSQPWTDARWRRYERAYRREMREPYRTLLGHFRHESGHYYWDLLISGTRFLEPFRAIFGDDRLDYGEALEDVEYLRCAWFEKTRWTHRITYRIAKLLDTPGLTGCIRTSGSAPSRDSLG